MSRLPASRELACDGCCGHGNEDGTCHKLEEGGITTVLASYNETIKEVDRRCAQIGTLRRRLMKMRKAMVGL